MKEQLNPRRLRWAVGASLALHVALVVWLRPAPKASPWPHAVPIKVIVVGEATPPRPPAASLPAKGSRGAHERSAVQAPRRHAPALRKGEASRQDEHAAAAATAPSAAPNAAAAPKASSAPSAASVPKAASAPSAAFVPSAKAMPSAAAMPPAAHSAASSADPKAAPSAAAARGAPAAAVPAAEQAGAAGGKATYLDEIRSTIEDHKVYPVLARRRHQTGRVEVSFMLEKDGGIKEARVLSPSPFSLLNDAALAAVTAAGPFRPIPPAIGHEELAIVVPLVFTLASR